MYQPNIALICLLVGLIAALNPIVIGLFLKKLTADFGNWQSQKIRIYLNSFIYILGFWLGILIIFFGTFFFLKQLDSLSFSFLLILISTLAIIFGTFKILGFILQKILYPAPGVVENLFHSISCKHNNYLNTFFLGLCSTFVAISSLGLVIILIVSLLILSEGQNLIQIITVLLLSTSTMLIGIMIWAIKSQRLAAIYRWKNDNILSLKLYSGLCQIVIAWLALIELIGKG